MSEDKVKITSDEPHVKDPKRVEAGKRLSAISKAAKEKKAKERYNREKELEEGTDWTIPIGIGAVGLIGICYICYKRSKLETNVEPEPTGNAGQSPTTHRYRRPYLTVPIEKKKFRIYTYIK